MLDFLYWLFFGEGMHWDGLLSFAIHILICAVICHRLERWLYGGKE